LKINHAKCCVVIDIFTLLLYTVKIYTMELK
jgi:hypothetical protein